MKSNTLAFSLFLGFCFQSAIAMGNVGQKVHLSRTINDCDSISIEKLFVLVSQGLQQMKTKDSLGDEKIITLIRVFNTLHLADITRSDKDSLLSFEFKEVFFKQYFPTVFQRIEMTYGKGMTFYSKRYDLFVGPVMEYRCKDLYIVSPTRQIR